MRKRRFFFALWPDPGLRQALAATRDDCADPQARVVKNGNLHLTLAFIGNVEPTICDALVAAGSAVSAASFGLDLDIVENKKSMLWLRPASAPGELGVLSELLWESVENRCGLERERRHFRPHVTLARKHPMPARSSDIGALHWRVDRFALVESVPADGGANYRPIREFALTRA